MGRVRITRPFVLLALAALMAPRAEASRTSVWESNPPAASVLAKTDASGLLASRAPTGPLESIVADAELVETPRFNLGGVVLIESEVEHEDRFGLGPLDLLGPTPLRGPPSSYPETRVRGFELLPPFRGGASPSLSLWSRRACGFSCREVASDSRYDPWGLLSEEELQARYYADAARMSSYGAVARDRARRELQAEQKRLESEKRSVFGHVVAGIFGGAAEEYAAWRKAPAKVQEAVRDAWRYRPQAPLDPDQIAAGGDYGRKTAEQLGAVAGEIQGKGAAGATQLAQWYAEGKAIELGLGAIGAIGAKRGPKAQGVGPHNVTIEDIAKQVEARGDTVVAGGGRAYPPEAVIPTLGGYKRSRRPDLLAQRPDGTRYGINIGKTEKSGIPVKRERQAIEDLEGPGGLEMHFVPYTVE